MILVYLHCLEQEYKFNRKEDLALYFSNYHVYDLEGLLEKAETKAYIFWDSFIGNLEAYRAGEDPICHVVWANSLQSLAEKTAEKKTECGYDIDI